MKPWWPNIIIQIATWNITKMNCDVHNDVIYNNYYHSLIARWGHCQEGYGEDPYLYVTALQ